MPMQSQGLAAKRSVTQVPVSELKVGMYVCQLDRPWLQTPFLLQGFPVRTPADIDEIARYCEFVYVDAEQSSVFDYGVGRERGGPGDKGADKSDGNKPYRPRPRSRRYDSSKSLREEVEQARPIHADARALTRSFMDDVRLGRAIDIGQVKTTVTACVKSMLRNPDAMLWLARIRKRDEYTSEHSLNVGLLAISFGRHLGFREEDIVKLGIAGMLHDVGKMRTPLPILNKTGKLTDEEFAVMRSHAVHGRDILMSHGTLFRGTVDVAHTHHESLNGTGYPRGVNASGINEFTRIVTLCDVYDAITSDRIYKDGKSSLEALRIIYKERGTRFDPELGQSFIQCIGLYPPGSIVELRSGQIGIVTSTNGRYRHLPRVLLLLDRERKPIEARTINLEELAADKESSKLVRTVWPNGSFGIRVEHFIRQGLVLG